MTPIGLAHLTLLRLSPPELVAVAAQAGYDFVGVRVKAVTTGEQQYPMEPGSPMSKETLRRLDDTGLEVRDIEFLTVGATTGPADWKPALDAGAALGARTLSVVGTDTDRSRLIDTLAALAADAHPLGIRPTLEPISYQPVATVTEAARIAGAAGIALLVDALHVQRGGSTVDDVRALDPALVPVLQLCDAPLEVPAHLELPADLPLGMTADGSVRQIEARARRRAVGEGELPLAALVAAAPAGTPLSVEVPDALRAARCTDLDIARHQLAATRTLLAGVAR
ncbi:TIM barrel protein [Pseudonocardia spirodelae]|uniref:TIM barrel protein n=1 Tax=Pseudonocardia spirodelae TaxID=3133431 RepID=A0ABU8T6B8_9PSEU